MQLRFNWRLVLAVVLAALCCWVALDATALADNCVERLLDVSTVLSQRVQVIEDCQRTGYSQAAVTAIAAALAAGAIGRALVIAVKHAPKSRPIAKQFRKSIQAKTARPQHGPEEDQGKRKPGTLPEDQRKQEDKKPRTLLLSTSRASMHADGAESAVLTARIVPADGTASASFTFHKATDLDDEYTTLSPSGSTAVLQSCFLETGNIMGVRVSCTAAIGGGRELQSEPVTVIVAAANPRFAINAPADVVGSGDGTIELTTELMIFGESRNDYQVTFSSTPAGIEAGPASSTRLRIPKLVRSDATYTVSAQGIYPVGDAEVDVSDSKVIVFRSLQPKLTLAASKQEIIGDGSDTVQLSVKGIFLANGRSFEPEQLSVDPPGVGSCTQPSGSSFSFVASVQPGGGDQAAGIVVHARASGDDGVCELTDQVAIRVIRPVPKPVGLGAPITAAAATPPPGADQPAAPPQPQPPPKPQNLRPLKDPSITGSRPIYKGDEPELVLGEGIRGTLRDYLRICADAYANRRDVTKEPDVFMQAGAALDKLHAFIDRLYDDKEFKALVMQRIKDAGNTLTDPKQLLELLKEATIDHIKNSVDPRMENPSDRVNEALDGIGNIWMIFEGGKLAIDAGKLAAEGGGKVLSKVMTRELPAAGEKQLLPPAPPPRPQLPPKAEPPRLPPAETTVPPGGSRPAEPLDPDFSSLLDEPHSVRRAPPLEQRSASSVPDTTPAESTRPPKKEGGAYSDKKISMGDSYRQKDIDWDVKYFNDAELESYRVVSDGERNLIYAESGRTVNTQRGIYIMDEHGNVYVHEAPMIGEVHHSSLAQGGDIAGGGQIKVENGKITSIDEGTGHYGAAQPSGRVHDVVRELDSQGVNMGGADIQTYGK